MNGRNLILIQIKTQHDDLASERGHLRVVQLVDEWQKPDPDPNQETTRVILVI